MAQQANNCKYRVYINRKPDKIFDSKVEAELYYFYIMKCNYQRIVLRNETESKVIWCFEKVDKFSDEYDKNAPAFKKQYFYKSGYWTD